MRLRLVLTAPLTPSSSAASRARASARVPDLTQFLACLGTMNALHNEPTQIALDRENVYILTGGEGGMQPQQGDVGPAASHDCLAAAIDRLSPEASDGATPPFALGCKYLFGGNGKRTNLLKLRLHTAALELEVIGHLRTQPIAIREAEEATEA